MEFETFSTFNKPIKDLTELKISVDYEKGGMNYFTGDNNKRGIYVYFTPIERTKYGFKTVILGDKKECGFKTCVKECGRKNTKAMSEIFQKINQKELLENITKLFEEEKFSDIVKLIIEKVN